jgi:hypothetical protein
MLMIRREAYGRIVRKEHIPSISKKKLDERVRNILQPTSYMGRGLAHADPAHMQQEHIAYAVPKSMTGRNSIDQHSSILPEIAAGIQNNINKPAPLDDEAYLACKKDKDYVAKVFAKRGSLSSRAARDPDLIWNPQQNRMTKKVEHRQPT